MGELKSLTEQMDKITADYDRQVLDGLIASIQARREAKAAVKREDFSGKYASTSYASAQLAAVGGKGWMELLRYNDHDAAERIRRVETMKAEARNVKIAAKLAKIGEVSRISNLGGTRSRDGFTGVWQLMTDAGPKRVTLQVILAGGYNIQCLHQRVLVNVS